MNCCIRVQYSIVQDRTVRTYDLMPLPRGVNDHITRLEINKWSRNIKAILSHIRIPIPHVMKAAFKWPHESRVFWHHKLPPLSSNYLNKKVIRNSAVKIWSHRWKRKIIGRFPNHVLGSYKSRTGRFAKALSDSVKPQVLPSDFIALVFQFLVLFSSYTFKSVARFGGKEKVRTGVIWVVNTVECRGEAFLQRRYCESWNNLKM